MTDAVLSSQPDLKKTSLLFWTIYNTANTTDQMAHALNKSFLTKTDIEGWNIGCRKSMTRYL